MNEDAIDRLNSSVACSIEALGEDVVDQISALATGGYCSKADREFKERNFALVNMTETNSEELFAAALAMDTEEGITEFWKKWIASISETSYFNSGWNV